MTNPESIDSVLAKGYDPSTLVFITTYKCTASCKSCCFGCSPKQPLAADPEKLMRFIESGVAGFPALKLVVFTGGECFLLGKSLDKLVSYAKTKNLLTRCVTNGFWAKTPDIATSRLRELIAAGLTEINFSAGFAHQEFVPTEFVLNGAISAAQLGMVAIISVEGDNSRKKGAENLADHLRIRQFCKEDPGHAKLLRILDTVWIGEDTPAAEYKTINRGCETILDSLVITPDFQLKSCCGLFANDINEMNMGKVSPETLKTRHTSQFDDFMKIWLKVDGPFKILAYVKTKHPEVSIPGFAHPCQACKLIYFDKKIRDFIQSHYKEKVAEVVFRFSASKEIDTRVNNLIGYGV